MQTKVHYKMGIFKTIKMGNKPQKGIHLYKVANKVETKEEIEEP